MPSTRPTRSPTAARTRPRSSSRSRELDEVPEDRQELLRTGYPLLVRGLANFCVMVADTPTRLDRALRHARTRLLRRRRRTRDDDAVVRRAFERIEPLASSELVITNELRHRLARTLVERRRANRADVARRPRARCTRPVARRVPDRRDPRPRATCGTSMLLFGIGGLSYGNVSARYLGGDLTGRPDPAGPVYWMSASGVDKSDLRLVGEHILLVRGYDPDRDHDGPVACRRP